jgi:protein-disulfide isomerase
VGLPFFGLEMVAVCLPTLGRRVAGVIAVMLAAVVGGCGTVGPRERALPRPVSDSTAVEARFAGIPQGGMALGAPSAPVTLVEFGDLQCPFCQRYALRVLPALLDRYVRPGRVRLEFRAVALLGPDSARAARAAMGAAEQDRLWQFIDLFYVNQGRENTGYVTDRFLRSIARGVRGLDPVRALRSSGGPSVTTQLAENLALARRWAIPGTPTFLVGPTGGRMSRLVLPTHDPRPFAQVLERLLRP